MAVASWPGTLPNPAYKGKVKYRTGLNSAEEDINPERQRTYPEREADFELKNLTAAQWQILRTFYGTTLNDGCALFTASWLVSMGFDFHYARFLDPPRVDSVDAKLFNAAIRVEIITGIETDGGGDPLIWPPADELEPIDKWG